MLKAQAWLARVSILRPGIRAQTAVPSAPVVGVMGWERAHFSDFFVLSFLSAAKDLAVVFKVSPCRHRILQHSPILHRCHPDSSHREAEGSAVVLLRGYPSRRKLGLVSGHDFAEPALSEVSSGRRAERVPKKWRAAPSLVRSPRIPGTGMRPRPNPPPSSTPASSTEINSEEAIHQLLR